MIQPDPDVIRWLHEECTNAVGYVIGDIRWLPERECLCVIEMKKNGYWSVRRELRDSPRRLSLSDYHVTIPPDLEQRLEMDGITTDDEVMEVMGLSPLDPDDPGAPRQCTLLDAREFTEGIYGRRKAVDEWRGKWIAGNTLIQQKAREHRKELAVAALKEVGRIAVHGHQPYVFQGAAQPAPSYPSGGAAVAVAADQAERAPASLPPPPAVRDRRGAK